MRVRYRINAPLDCRQVLRLFKHTDWADRRTPVGVRTMLRHTHVHVSAWQGRRLVGFVRAVTDTVYRAVIDDLIVDPEHRGRGIGHELMMRLGEQLSRVEEVFLGCDVAQVRFYERLGYQRAGHPHMKRISPPGTRDHGRIRL